MASSMDFKDLFERYQRVGAKNGISIVNYCKINGLRRVKYIADVLRKLISGETVQSPNQKIPDRKTKCVIKTHINIKQNVIFGAKLKPV